MVIASHFGLTRDPFSPFVDPADAFDSQPYRAGRKQMRRLLRRKVPLIAITGEAGSGKTMLLRATERCCSTEGVAVRRLERGDLATKWSGDDCDLLLIDEADKIDGDALDALTIDTDGMRKPPVILALLHPCPNHLSRFGPGAMIELARLDRIEAALYLIDRVERAGAPDLFTPEALDAIVDAADGSIQMLRVLGSNALFQAALDEVPLVEAKHARQAAAKHGRSKRPLHGPVQLRTPAPTNLPHDEALPVEEQGQPAGRMPAPPSAPAASDRAFVELEAAWPGLQPIELRWTGVKRNDAEADFIKKPMPRSTESSDAEQRRGPDRRAAVPTRSRAPVPAVVAGEVTLAAIACLLIWFAETGPSYPPEPQSGPDVSRAPLSVALDPFGIVKKEPVTEAASGIEPAKMAAVERRPSPSTAAASRKAKWQPARAQARPVSRATDRLDAAGVVQPRLVASLSPARCRPMTDSGCASPETWTPRSKAQISPVTAVPTNVVVTSVRTEIDAIEIEPRVAADGDGAMPTAAIDPATVMEAEAAREQAKVIREAAMAARDTVRAARMGRGGG